MRSILLFVFGLVIVSSAAAPAQASVFGEWLTEGNRSVVTIFRCGNAVCGRVSRILVDVPGGTARDINNRNANLRDRPLLGLRILSGLRRDGSRYRGGQIYDPDSGRSYGARIQLNSNDTLRVTGCIFGGVACRSQNWNRR